MQAARRTIAAASTAATVLALATPAHAATITAPPCVASVGTVPISGTGFTPGSLVTVKYATSATGTPSYLTSATADVAGNFTASAGAPSFNPFSRNLQTFTIGAGDNVNPALTAFGSFKQVRVGYSTNPSTGNPRIQATHTVRGLTPGRNTYLHFRYHGATKRNIKLGTADSPCGIASKRMRLLPTTSHPGEWTVYADQAATYHRGTQPQLKYRFTIRRTFG